MTTEQITNDIFQLEATTTDGVCIMGLAINGKPVSAGQNRDVIVLDKNQHICTDDEMETEQITIQNGLIVRVVK